MTTREKNVFFDINKLPGEWGIMIFPISMSRIANAQSPDKCLEYIRIFNPSKIQAPLIGLNFLYCESLYLDYDISSGAEKDLHSLRKRYKAEVSKHKNRMQEIVRKLTTTEFQIPWAIDYMSWDQALINTSNFSERFSSLKKIYEADVLFQKYIKEDCEAFGKEVTDAQIDFFLEEHLLCYLISRGEVSFHNNHVQDRQKWILWCYPGKPPKSLVYLHQLNPFKLSWKENKYEKCVQYDLVGRKLYDAEFIDLETYSVK